MMFRVINRVRPGVGLLDGFDRVLDRAFDAFPELASLSAAEPCFPAVNVSEDEATVYVEAEIPGLTLEDVEIMVQGDELTIQGERKAADREGATFHHRELAVGAFDRTLRLPVEINTERVEATLRDGVLKVTLPKADAVLPRKIEVKG